MASQHRAKTPTTSRGSSRDMSRDAARAAAFKLIDSGLSSDEAARKLGIARSSISAWLAHRTRGTY